MTQGNAVTIKLADLLPLRPPPALAADLPAVRAAELLREWHVEMLPVAGQAGRIWVLDAEGGAVQRMISSDLPAGYILTAADLTYCPPALAQQVWQGFSPQQQGLLSTLAHQVAQHGAGTVAVVGGAVRDMLLGSLPVIDLDLVLVGQEVEPLARQLAGHYGAGLSVHAAYGNATLHLPQITLDLISARMERYPVAGRPPEVWPATLSQDLARRDFSLNALALVLTPAGVRLHDPVGGLADLQARTLRPLHAQSFHEDASRLVRAARLAARLSLRAHPDLLAQVEAALEVAASTPRLWAEVRLSLSEPQPGRVLTLLAEWGAKGLLPARSAELLSSLDRLSPRASDLVYAAALLSLAPQPAALAERLGLGKRPLALLERAESGKAFAPLSPETALRGALFPARAVSSSLTGRDLLALGLPAGPVLGQALAYLQTLRRTGALQTPDDERRAASAWWRQKVEGEG